MAKGAENPLATVGIDLLRSFATVVETHSYSKAARLLGVTQPAVSGHVKRLQEQLRTPLFLLDGRGVVLNRQGELVLSYAREILSLNDRMLQHLHRRSEPVSEIRIGLTNEIRWSAAQLLTEITARHGHQGFIVHRGSSERLREQFLDGQLELAMLVGREPIHDSAVFRATETLIWAAADTMAVKPGQPVKIILAPEGCLCRDIALECLARSGLAYQVVLHARDVSEAIDAAEQGIGHVALLKSNLSQSLRIFGADSGLPSLEDYTYHWGILTSPHDQDEIIAGIASGLAAQLTPELPRY